MHIVDVTRILVLACVTDNALWNWQVHWLEVVHLLKETSSQHLFLLSIFVLLDALDAKWNRPIH